MIGQFKWLVLGFIIGGLLAFAADASADTPFNINAKSALVINVKTNEVVLGKNANDVRPIASITKLMTAIVVLAANLPLSEKIVITSQDVEATMLRGRPYSGSLPVGTVLSREELLHLALMNSQNRAAAALARSYPGGTSEFVRAMNNHAAILGMTHTHFTEPTGLSSTNVSSPHDLAIMAKHAYSYDLIRNMSTSKYLKTYVRVGDDDKPALFGTTNRLLKTPSWDIDIQKTGYITAAGRCLLMITNVNDTPFLVVLLNSKSSYQRAADAIQIKHWIQTGAAATRSQLNALNPYKNTIRKKHTRKKNIKKRNKVR